MKRLGALFMLILVCFLVALPVSADSLERSNPVLTELTETKIINQEEVFQAQYTVKVQEEIMAFVAHSIPAYLAEFFAINNIYVNDVDFYGYASYNNLIPEAILVPDTSKKKSWLLAKGGSAFSRNYKPGHLPKYNKRIRII